MKCTEVPTEDCDNLDMKKCSGCIVQMLCLCQRPEVRAMVQKLWKESNEPKMVKNIRAPGGK
jgi:hypothetical protein